MRTGIEKGNNGFTAVYDQKRWQFWLRWNQPLQKPGKAQNPLIIYGPMVARGENGQNTLQGLTKSGNRDRSL